MGTPQGESGATAIARVRAYANEPTLPVDAVMLTFLNKGLEEVVRRVGGIKLYGSYPTVTNQTTIILNDDVQDIVSANFSQGNANAANTGSASPFAQGALVYPMFARSQAAFYDDAAGFPAVGFGPPQEYFIYSDYGTGPSQTLPAPLQAQLGIVTGTSNGVTVEVGLTYVNPSGETTIGTVADQAISTVQQAQVLSPQAVSNASGYNVYAGAVGGPYHLQSASPIALGVPFTIPYPLLTVTIPPVTNTAIGAGTGGALSMQLYPAAIVGQVNIEYRARPLLWADNTSTSWTNLDTSIQEAAILFALSRVLAFRGRMDEWKSIWKDEYEAMCQDLKESIGRRTRPRSGQVRDVRNRSYPSAGFFG